MQRLVRTFIAVETGSDVRTRAVQLINRLKHTSDAVSWVASQNLHWTVKFLGDVDQLEIPAVCDAVAKVAAKTAPFDVLVRGVGAFPDVQRPRTIWMGVEDGREEFIDLARRVDLAMQQLGFRLEARRFVPHLTLGRARGSGGNFDDLTAQLAKYHEYAGGAMSVDELVVFSSTLQRSGPLYEVLSSSVLQAT